jgi:uncharacterized membrane protein
VSVNDTGQVVGFSVVDGVTYAAEWSGDSIINLGLPDAAYSAAESINDKGQIVGESSEFTPPVPETSTWAMMLFGFAGLALAGYRRTKARPATLASSFADAQARGPAPCAAILLGHWSGSPIIDRFDRSLNEI